jgi:phenylalanyl-tRNA synthetase alpha chain
VKKRKLVKQETWKTYTIAKGPHFALERKKVGSDEYSSPRHRMPA